MNYRNTIIFLLFVTGVFLLALSDSKTLKEFGIYGVGSIEDEYIQMRDKMFNLHKVKEEERIVKITALLQGEENAIKKTAGISTQKSDPAIWNGRIEKVMEVDILEHVIVSDYGSFLSKTSERLVVKGNKQLPRFLKMLLKAAQ